MEAHKF
jgi:hypothetical protein